MLAIMEESHIDATDSSIFVNSSIYTTTYPQQENNSSEETSGMQRLVYITEAHIEPMIFIFGIVTNIFNFVIIRNMRISKVIRIMLLSLTVSDFLASVHGFLTIILEILIFKGKMPYGMWLPGVVEIFTCYKLYLMFIGISSALVILIAVVRCYSMLHPFEWTATITYRKIVKTIIIIIIVTVILFIPLSLYVMWKSCFLYQEKPDEIDTIPGDPRVCLGFFDIFPLAKDMKYYFFCVALLLGPGTIISNLVCFIKLKQAINDSANTIREMQERRGSESSIVEQQSSRNSRLNRMFLWVLLFNSICITPSIIQIVCLQIDPQRFLFDKENVWVAVSDIVAEVFLGALPCYNFWTYLIVNKDFRRRFKLLCCCCCFKNTKDQLTNSRTPEPSPRPGRMYIGEPRGNQL